jgi:hypothetical protein
MEELAATLGNGGLLGETAAETRSTWLANMPI